jgi:hypothetical protein
MKAAFSVRAGVDVSALGEGVKTGEVAEIFAKVKKNQDGPAVSAVGFGGMRPAAVARPGQQRGGRRGGLGYKRGGFGGVGTAAKSGGAPADGETNGAAPARSNADFKAMFEKSREQQAEPKKAEE